MVFLTLAWGLSAAVAQRNAQLASTSINTTSADGTICRIIGSPVTGMNGIQRSRAGHSGV